MNEKNNIDGAFLVALKRGDVQTIKAVYEEAYPLCASLVLNNQGTKEDAKDIFQEALIVLIKKLKQEDFQLSANVKTYLYAIVRNLWLKHLRNTGKKGLLLVLDEPEGALTLLGEEELGEQTAVEKEAKHESVEKALKEISEECRQIILSYYYHKMSLKEIAEQLDYTDNFVKVKKKRCMDALKEKVLTNHSEA